MDKKQIGLALGIAGLCLVLWLVDGDNAGGVGEVGVLGLVAVAFIALVRLLQRR